MAKLVLSLSSVISSNKEGRFSSAALGLVKGFGREAKLSCHPVTVPWPGFPVWVDNLGRLLHRDLKSLLQTLEV